MNWTQPHAHRPSIQPCRFGRMLKFEQLEERQLLAADMFEPNNSVSQASDLGFLEQFHMGLTLDGPRDEDWYQWTARKEGTLTVDVFFRHDLGNIDLRLYDANQQLLTQSASNTDDEQVTWQVEVGQTVFIHVLGDASPGYDLEIGVQPGGANDPPTISQIPDQRVLSLQSNTPDLRR